MQKVRERLSPVRVQGQPPARYDAVGFDAMVKSRHQRITPYTPRHNGKIERYNRILA